MLSRVDPLSTGSIVTAMMSEVDKLPLLKIADHALPRPEMMKWSPEMAPPIGLPKLAAYALRTSMIEGNSFLSAGCGAVLGLAILPFGYAAVDIDKPMDPIFSEAFGLPPRAASTLCMSNIA